MGAFGLLYAVGLAAAILPVSFPASQTSPSDTCGAKITQIEEQVEYAVGSPRIIHFIEDNTTAFKAIHGRYTAYWLGTKFSWKNDLSTCSATLQSITASFEIGNSTLPFVGMAHVTIDPSMTRVVNVQFDFPSFQPYQKPS